MNIQQYRIVAVGHDQPTMLSSVIHQLSLVNYEISNISSLRLGHSFIIVIQIEAAQDKKSIENCLQEIKHELNLKLIIDKCEIKEYKFVKSDAYLRVEGKHIAGIKSYIISEFANAGLDIHGLESRSSNNSEPHFIIDIKGKALQGFEKISDVVDKLQQQEMKASIARDRKLLF
jgi:prephenate dehydratase